MTLEFLIGPLVGGIIGYITNNIAIKMLFRPLKPIYIGGKKLPFTPGMIPREQARIAHTIGTVVEKELIDPKILKEYLLSQEMYINIENIIYQWFVDKRTSTLTVEEYIKDITSDKAIEMLREAVEDRITQEVYNKVKESNISEPIVEQMEKTIKESIGPLSMFIGDSVIETIKGKINIIIQELIETQGEEVIGGLVAKNVEDFMQTPLNQAVGMLEKELSKIKYVILKHYTQFIEEHLYEVLKNIKFADVIEEKIKSYDAKKMEELILSVVKKELNAIVWLGALLGAIMGLIMNFI